MAFTQSDLDNINAAIAKGARKYMKDGRLVEYHSMDDMIKARDTIRQELFQGAATASNVSRPRAYRARTRKGL